MIKFKIVLKVIFLVLIIESSGQNAAQVNSYKKSYQIEFDNGNSIYFNNIATLIMEGKYQEATKRLAWFYETSEIDNYQAKNNLMNLILKYPQAKNEFSVVKKHIFKKLLDERNFSFSQNGIKIQALTKFFFDISQEIVSPKELLNSLLELYHKNPDVILCSWPIIESFMVENEQYDIAKIAMKKGDFLAYFYNTIPTYQYIATVSRNKKNDNLLSSSNNFFALQTNNIIQVAIHFKKIYEAKKIEELAQQALAENGGNVNEIMSVDDNLGEQGKIDAVKNLEEADTMSKIDAKYYLALAYNNGKIVPQNKEKAVKYFKEAAKAGRLEANFLLGDAYFWGEGVTVDRKKAFEYYLIAAKHEIPYAQLRVGLLYWEGKGIEKNLDKAIYWLEKAAAIEGYQFAQCCLGNLYYEYENGKSKYISKAIQIFEKLAEEKYSFAFLSLGDCYRYGVGVDKNLKKAEECFKQAADCANDDDEKDYALAYLTVLYIQNPEFNQNLKKNFTILNELASKNNSEAYWGLAYCYEYGIEVEADKNKMLYYLKKAAEEMHYQAQLKLESLAEQKN